MITQLRLRNFKLFQSVLTDFAPITVFSGINGAGKSSVIQALLLLKQSYEIKYLQSLGQVDLQNDYINLETADDLCYSFAADNDRNIDIALTNSDHLQFKWTIDASDPTAKILKCNYEGARSIDTLPVFSKDFIFLDADRWGPKSVYYKKENRAYNTVLGIQGELTPAYLQRAMQTNESLSIEGLAFPGTDITMGLYENVNLWLSSIIGTTLKTSIIDIDESRLKLKYSTYGSKGLSYSALQIGFGVTYTLPIIVALLRAKKGDLIIVENPESHLHPSAQSKLGGMLAIAAEYGVQLIIETHSEHIINGIRLGIAKKQLSHSNLKIYFFSQTISHNSIIPSSKEVGVDMRGELTDWPTNFFDQSEIDYLEILRSRRKQ